MRRHPYRRQRPAGRPTLQAGGLPPAIRSPLFHASRDALILIDQAQTVRAMNPAAARLLGCQDPACRGRSWRQFFRLERRLAQEWRHNPIVACLEDGHDHTLGDDTILAWRNQRMPVRGDVFSLETGRGPCALLSLQTIDEKPAQQPAWQQEQEFLLQHMSRLNTVSELATGIAHEMNQPLSAIMSFGQAALRLLAEDKPDIDLTAEALAGTISQTRRASDILERLRAFVGRQELRMAPVAVNQVIINALTLLSSTLAEAGVRVSLHTEPCPPVRADSVQLEQVMVNLVRNAIDAMQASAAGTRTLEIVSHPLAGNVHVAITDSGPGLAPEALSGLFTRFFTTKPEGMGLGLSICRSIVEAAGGEIIAQNASEGGACFRIRLPVYTAEGARDGHAAA